jgi:hypothetical protein
LRYVSSLIATERQKLTLPGTYDETVRALRISQARLFRDSGYDLEKMIDCAFVWQYADVHELSPREACDTILLQGELFEAELWKTEGLQLRYRKRILDSKEPAELETIQEEFRREFGVNAL